LRKAETGKKPKNAEFLVLQASQHFRIAKKWPSLLVSMSPVEA
jgi:hypothetical protein